MSAIGSAGGTGQTIGAAARRPQGRLSRRAWRVQLAAPHTWPAAVLPPRWWRVACRGRRQTGRASAVSMACALLTICVLMQSAVNTFNDYYDYVKGADSADDNVDPTDAVLVYNNVDPRAALALAVGLPRGGVRWSART